jgi:hypothetical protein
MIVCQVFISEILRLRSLQRNWAPGIPVGDEAQLTTSVQTVIATMAMFAANCSIISELLSSLEA